MKILKWSSSSDVDKVLQSERGCKVGFCDWNFLALSSTDIFFNGIVSQFDYVFCDGYWVYLYNKLYKQGSHYLTGPDMLKLFLDSGKDLLFLGLNEADVVEIRLKFPGTRIENVSIPYVDDVENLEIEQIRKDILEYKISNVFVSIGCPKQERLIALLGDLPKIKLFGTGAAVFFLSGKERRAPRFIRTMKIEFIWRLLLNPRKQSKKWRNIFKFVFQRFRRKI